MYEDARIDGRSWRFRRFLSERRAHEPELREKGAAELLRDADALGSDHAPPSATVLCQQAGRETDALANHVSL